MTPRNFALIIGIVYLAVGIFGFIPGLLRPAPESAPPVGITAFYGYLMGLFAVNLLHNAVHLAIGAWGIAASRTATRARTYAKTLAIFYGALAVMGLIPVLDTMFGLVPIHGHDVWLHAATALAAAYFGWVWKGTESSASRATAH
jgi:hypothetical protein